MADAYEATAADKTDQFQEVLGSMGTLLMSDKGRKLSDLDKEESRGAGGPKGDPRQMGTTQKLPSIC